MAGTKQKRHYQSMTDKAVMARENEKIINDFLLQFAYTLTIGVISIFIYNALGIFGYGLDVYNGTRALMWTIFGICFAGGIALTILYIIKGKNRVKISAVYLYATAFVAFWYVGVEKIFFALKGIIPFMEKFASSQKIIFAIFPLLGIAIIAEFAVYFARYYSLNGKRKRR